MPSRPRPGRDVSVGGVAGKAWRSRRGDRPLVVLPGVAPQGADDPRVIRAASALSDAGRFVFIPELTVRHVRLDVEDVERIVTCTEALVRAGAQPTLLGFSFGGSYALVAAADPRIRRHVRLVAAFGAYADLVSLLGAATTGVSTVDDGDVRWEERPREELQLALRLVEALAAQDEADLDPAAARALGDALTGRGAVEGLAGAARAIHDLLVNRDAARVDHLVARLPPRLNELLVRLSPVHVAADVAAPVALLHSTTDRAIPYAEARRLERTLPSARLFTVTSFRHVDVTHVWRRPVEVARDLTEVLRFGRAVLGASRRR